MRPILSTAILLGLLSLVALGAAAKGDLCVTSASYRDEYSIPDQQDDLIEDPVSSEYAGYQGHQVLYINFDAFTKNEKATEAWQIVVENFAPFDITVTDQQPAAHPYSQIDVRDCDCTAHGLANKDCGNSTLDNTGYVEARPDPSREPTSTELGDLISHEAGHNFGLEHVDDAGNSPEIMRPGWYISGRPKKAFTDICLPSIDYACASAHQQLCPANQQNSYAELMLRFGPNPGTDSDIDSDTGSDSESDSDSNSDSDSDSDADGDDDDNDDDNNDDNNDNDDDNNDDIPKEETECGCKVAGSKSTAPGIIENLLKIPTIFY